MKRQLIKINVDSFPSRLHSLLCGGEIYDSSCSPEARVYFVNKDDGYFIKKATKDSLLPEHEMARYFSTLKYTRAPLDYFSDGVSDWLITPHVVGEDCTGSEFISDPKRLAVLLGETLRAIHETDGAGCPVRNRMNNYFSLAESNYEKGLYDLSFYLGKSSRINADELWRYAYDNRAELKNEVLIHGDYCLPNVILNDWKLSGLIDLGNGGIGDRHVDLFWGAWTLRFNLNSDDYRDVFFDSYGRDKIEMDKIELISAYECFG